MNLIPLYNNVIVEKQEIEENYHGNIIVPDLGKEKATLATVIAVGPGWTTLSGTRIMSDIRVGDKVYYPGFGGQKIDVEGKEYMVFKDTDLLTIVDRKEEYVDDLPF